VIDINTVLFTENVIPPPPPPGVGTGIKYIVQSKQRDRLRDNVGD
jgi:hypothetical protein